MFNHNVVNKSIIFFKSFYQIEQPINDWNKTDKMYKTQFKTMFTYVKHVLHIKDIFKSNKKEFDPPPQVVLETPIWLLQWSKLVNAIRANEILLHMCVMLLLAVIVMPLVYVIFKKVILKICTYVCTTDFMLFSNKNYVQLSLPETYNETQNVNDWLEQFNLYCVANRLTNDRLKKDILLSRLRPETRELIKTRISDNESFDKTIKLIITIFSPKKLTLALEYASYRQSYGENVQKYYTELCRRAKRALPDVPKKVFEESVMSKFLDGLRDVSLKDKLLMDHKNVKRLDDLITTAFELEQKLNRGNETAYLAQNAYNQPAENSNRRFARTTKHCTNCNKMGHVINDCWQLKRRNGPVNNNYSQQPSVTERQPFIPVSRM
jgi:hypothetical protein